MRTHRLPKWGKRLLILAGLLAALLFAMLLAQTLVAHRPGTSFTPDYAQEDLSALLAQDSLSASDYQTLFLQTGLGRSAVDRLLSPGKPAGPRSGRFRRPFSPTIPSPATRCWGGSPGRTI